MTEPDPNKLKDLGARLAAAREAQKPEPPRHAGMRQSSEAWRMVIELVSGIGVGFAMGYGIDSVFGTMPVFLVIFTLLGFAAGVRVMIQTAQGVQRRGDVTDEEQDG